MGERRGTKALELWCRRMTDGYPGVKIDNMTTSWRDGLAFCAMIHHFRPDLIEFEKLNKSDIYYNNDLAFRTAERHLGIPALLDADDMAAYEVPDRLSILTYLSQFYQVFAAQDSPNRLKRSSATTEKSQITKAQGPPAKMAHVVGVPKRDPCQKCNLPVFLAERLTVGKRVYHRTCLKCARCSSQLTPGSFYETEVDGEYCCETCPDEEQSLDSETDVVLRNPPAESYDSEITIRPKTTVRSSIAERLAFFEHSKDSSPSSSSSSKLLQKSLSDEEKTKSLKKMSGESTSPYKMNAALSSFMHSTLNDEVDEGSEVKDQPSSNPTKMDTSESLGTSSESDGEEEDDEEDGEGDKPPELPTTLPPLSVRSKSSTLEKEERIVEPIEEHTEDLLSEEKPEDLRVTTRAEITLRPAKEVKTTDNMHASDGKYEIITNDDAQEVSLSQTSIIFTPADDLNLSNSKSNFVTKDNTEHDEQMRTTNATTAVDSDPPPSNEGKETAAGPAENVQETPGKEGEVTQNKTDLEKEEVEEDQPQEERPTLRQRPITLDIKDNCNSDMTAAAREDEETAKRLSVVRARLHQFEVIANNKNINDNLMSKTPENSSSVSSSIKSENNSVKQASTPPPHQDEEKKTEDTVPATVDEASPSPVADVEELNMKSNEVPKNDEATELDVDEVGKGEEGETVSIEETKLQQDDATTPASIPLVASSEENAELKVGQKPLKLIEVDLQMDVEEAIKQNLVEEGEEVESKQTAMEVEKPQSQLQPRLETEVAETKPAPEPESKIQVKEDIKPFTSPAKVNLELYPEELNPFKSDDEEDGDDIAPLPAVTPVKPVTPAPRRSLNSSTPTSAIGSSQKDRSLNPFDSSDDEVEIEKKVKPPRPPPPKISKNPFGSESEEGGDENNESMANMVKKPPVPAPRTNVSLSQNPTPEPTPRLSSKHPTHHISPLNNSSDFYGSNSSLGSTPYSLQRNTDVRGSNNSLTSSTGTIRSRKSRKAPAPPPPVKELFPSNETLDSKKSSPSSSNSATPHQGRKKRPAPAPPKPARLLDSAAVLAVKTDNNDTGPKNSLSYPLQSDLDKLSDEEKALLEGNRLEEDPSEQYQKHQEPEESNITGRKLIPLDLSLVSDSEDLVKQKEEDNVIYRRTIIPSHIVTPTHDEPVFHDRQLEKMKDNKEAQNRNRQSQVSSGAEDSDPLYNKSSHGKWKRRKGPAPALPIPPRKVLQMLPLQEIRHELDIIEVQQQGLEKQGVILEKMIRDRCEGKNGELDAVDNPNAGTAGQPQNSKEVEDLILQLFELVNEKNELFRRQAELMYLRRQHRLEQEQADLEYEIRVLMAQPERNKTDSDKAREEALIARMVEVVQLRNEVVECLEMDRLREAEEDLSIKQRLELHSAKREQESNRHTLSKLSKKEKKKQKETKKLGKSKKLDADKDADESEISVEKLKTKKKKKKFLF